MSKWIKNSTGGDKTWVGQLIATTAYYEIQSNEELAWSNNAVLLTDIANGDAVVAKDDSGTKDITDVNEAINYLKDIDSSPKDSDGSILVRAKATIAGWTYEARGFRFKTSDLDSIVNKKYDNSDLGDVIIKLYDINDVEITEAQYEVNAVKTVVDFEPTHDYEVIGGQADALEDLQTLNKDLTLWVVAVPDVPAIYGGSKTMITNVNLKYSGDNRVETDGRASKRLNYDATNHTNKMRFILRHAAGDGINVQIMMELFKT